jgi:DNA invertase Pin-like site-specific DNA recombinase
MERGKSQLRRCAIYTRKSSEEGLEQDFNSLQAQREACEAFIKSQHGEGWRLVRAAYDDGGFSGGTMERPALQRLLADIRDRVIDVLVVYKVDRLTRSLADFAKMVELFDAHAVSFVAVTQQFNTTSSMGRLTLNVLLSFAQFEREVTGERIRDKIAASKRRGMWMGGTVALGYDVSDHRQVINPAEAETVKGIFQRYLELRSVRLLKDDLDRRGIISKIRLSRNGNRSGGKAFSRGALYELLSNPVYVGEIRHRKERHPGQHEPIMDRDLWERVQRQLRDQAARGRTRAIKAGPSPLAGKLFDKNGECLYVAGAANAKRRYRYYVSRHLVTGSADKVRNGWRLSGPEIERTVAVAARQLLNDHAAISASACNLGVGAGDIPAVLEAAGKWSRSLQSEMDSAAALCGLVDRVNLNPGGIELSINLPLPVDGTHGAAATLPITQFFAMRMKRRGVEMRLIIGGADAPPRKPDVALLKAIARAHLWFEELICARATSLAAIASREGVTDRYVARLIRLAFLAPKIVEAMAERGELVDLKLTPHVDLPLDWTTQERVVGLE